MKGFQKLHKDETAELQELLKDRVKFTRNLQAHHFNRKYCSRVNRYAGVYEPADLSRAMYPIKGRFFIKQEAGEKLMGFVGIPENTLKGYIGKDDNGVEGFDMTITWKDSNDTTQIGLDKTDDVQKSRKGRLSADRDTLRFKYKHGTWKDDISDYQYQNLIASSLVRFKLSTLKRKLFNKIIDNVELLRCMFQNIGVGVFGEYFGLDKEVAQMLAFCMIKAGIIDASIDQEDSYLYFSKSTESKSISREIFLRVQDIVQKIKKEA